MSCFTSVVWNHKSLLLLLCIIILSWSLEGTTLTVINCIHDYHPYSSQNAYFRNLLGYPRKCLTYCYEWVLSPSNMVRSCTFGCKITSASGHRVWANLCAQTVPSVLPISMCIMIYCSSRGHHLRLHLIVESRKRLEPWPSSQGQSPLPNTSIQDMGIATPPFKSGIEIFMILPYSEVIDVCII